MRPIRVATTVEQPREDVFAFLDVLANHEPLTDHMLVDWSFSGPASGVGARSRMRAKLPGPKDWVELEVLAAEPPATIVEETVGAGGQRRTRGTYRLTELPTGATRVEFELAFLAVPRRERLLLALLRSWLRRGNEKAMRRLAQRLAQRPSSEVASAPSPAA